MERSYSSAMKGKSVGFCNLFHDLRFDDARCAFVSITCGRDRVRTQIDQDQSTQYRTASVANRMPPFNLKTDVIARQ